MTLQFDIVITTLSFLPTVGYKTPSALCSAFFTIAELFIMFRLSYLSYYLTSAVSYS